MIFSSESEYFSFQLSFDVCGVLFFSEEVLLVLKAEGEDELEHESECSTSRFIGITGAPPFSEGELASRITPALHDFLSSASARFF